MLTVAHAELTQPVFNEDNIRTLSSSSSKIGHPQGGGTAGGHRGQTYPVSLAVEQRRGLVEHLLESLLLGDALGEGRGVGVDLVRGRVNRAAL